MQDPITLLVTVNFIAYGILANAYWSDAARFGRRLLEVKSTDIDSRIGKNRRRAETLFRLCTGIMAFILLIMLSVIFVPNSTIEVWCKGVMAILTILMMIFCVLYASGYYFVQIDED